MSQSSVLTIGNFDGVHLGHQAILRRARQVADGCGEPVKALTFDPHPATILRPDQVPPRLMTCEDKCRALLDAGADEVVVLVPDRDLLARSPVDFIRHLCEHQQPSAVVEGHDFHFGRDRQGGMDDLRRLGEEAGFEVHEVETIERGLTDLLLAPVRSSLIRWLLGCGRTMDAATCLGRPYVYAGTVQRGEQRGSTIGISTANLDPAQTPDRMAPGDGVYVGEVELADGATHRAAISVGVKPTFGERRLLIEAHLIDYDGDLYDQTIAVHFHRWLRDQQRFPSVEALRDQLQRDIARARQLPTIRAAG